VSGSIQSINNRSGRRFASAERAARLLGLDRAASEQVADAMGEGWFLKLRLADPKELDALMDEAAYEAFVAEQH